MKQPIHFLIVKHRTCSTKKNFRRSPVAGPSYDAGIALLDQKTGRTVFRQHTDGTEIIYNEIFSADKNCPYGNKSIPLKDRMTALWNDLYELNRNNSERVAVYGEIAIPNNITDAQMIELTKRLGEYMARTYNRPFQLSLHKKQGNNHIHFSGAERAYINGKFLQKRYKFYKDWNGKLLRNKKYYDEKGWDVRKPKIDKTKVPQGANPYERNPETGNYLFQKLDKQNRKQWECDTRTGKIFGKKDLSKLHNDIDNIINSFLQQQGYMITVKRNLPEVTQMLNDLRIGQIRIPTRDYKTDSALAREIRKRNEHNKNLQKEFEKIFAKLRVVKTKIDVAKEIEATKLQSLLSAQEEKILADKDFADANNEYKLVRNIIKKSANYLSKTIEI